MTASFRCIVFCESALDFRVSTELFVRELETIEGVSEWVRAAFAFVGLDDSEPFSPWTSVRERADQEGVPRLHGHRADRGADGATAWRALQLAKSREHDCVLLVRDCDSASVEDKRADIELGVRRYRINGSPTRVVVGAPGRMIEAWLIAAMVCSDEVKADLSFDPCTAPERLTASGTSESKLNPKKVLARLAAEIDALDVLSTIDLEVLSSNARLAGLPEYRCSIRCEAGRLVSDDSRLCDCVNSKHARAWPVPSEA